MRTLHAPARPLHLAADPDKADLLRRTLQRYRLDPGLALHRATEMWLIRRAQPLAPLLEVGCDDGTFAQLALDGLIDAPDRFGCDLDSRNLAAASSRYRLVLAADGARLPYREGSFRTVMANSMLAHVDDLPGCLAEFQRVLSAGGRLFATVPTPRFHRWFAPARALRSLGFQCAAAAVSRRYDCRWHQQHFLDRADWEARLSAAGLRLESWTEYFDARSSTVWSSWFVVWRLGLGRLTVGAVARRIFPTNAGRTRWLENELTQRLAVHATHSAGGGGSALLLAVKAG